MDFWIQVIIKKKVPQKIFGNNLSDANQVLKASELNLNLKGFGISFARGMDVDNNQYPDIIVGAHNSNSAVVLRSHPVVHYQGEITFDTDGVNAYNSQFTMTVHIG